MSLSAVGPTDLAVSGRVLAQIASTDALTNGSNYTSSWVDVSGFNSLVVAVATDQNGYFEVQLSPDGTNADSTLTRYYKVGEINAPARFTITRRYARVRFFNNSGSNQTYFRLQCLVGDKADLNIPTDAVMSQAYDSISVRPSNYTDEVALGRRQGVVSWNKWGYNLDVDTGSQESIWPPGTPLSPLTTARTIGVASSSTADTSAGTGARTIRIVGIDANRDYQTEDVTMNGTSTVTTTKTWLGINRAEVLTAGSGLVNAGNITLTATTAGTVQAYIPASSGITQQAFFFTEANTVAAIDWLFVNITKIVGGGSPRVTVRGYVRNFTRGVRYLVFQETLDTAVDNNISLVPTEPILVAGSSVIEFTAETDTNNTIVNLRFSLKQYDDVGF